MTGFAQRETAMYPPKHKISRYECCSVGSCFSLQLPRTAVAILILNQPKAIAARHRVCKSKLCLCSVGNNSLPGTNRQVCNNKQ